MMRFTCVLLFVIGLIPELAFGQSFYAIRRERTIIGTLGTGISSYFGDLKDSKRSLDAKLNITGGMQFYITDRISLRADLTYFRLEGSDANTDTPVLQRRNLSFVADNFELAATGAVNLLPNGRRFHQRPVVNVYGFGGIGVIYSNPKAELNGKKYALQPLETEGVKYSRIQPVIPVGLGLRFMLNPFFNLSVEAGHRITFTDYLDDVSTVHPDKSGWTDPVRIALSDRRPELGLTPYEPGSRRGNADNNDSYFLLNVKVEYYIPDNVFWTNGYKKTYRMKRKQAKRR